MITTGYPFSSATKTEVVDVVSGETCADLADFPLSIDRAVGGNINGELVVCGGRHGTGIDDTYYQTCYKFTISGWQEFASMKEERGSTAGVLFQNKFHVFGGLNGNDVLQTSELITIDGGVEYGPELPTT